MKTENGRPQLHISAIEMKCPEAFRRRYIEGEIIPPGVAMVVGTGTHEGIRKNLKSKIETGRLLPLEAVEQAARDGLESAWSGGVKLEDEELAEGIKKVKAGAIEKTIRLARTHATELAPVIQPTAVERPIAVELKGYPVDLVGTMDIQEGKLAIRDSKTTASTPNKDVAHKSIQLTGYALAVKVIDGQAPEKVFLDYVIDNKAPVAKVFESARDDSHFRAFLARVETLCRAMEKGVFQPVEPGHWACSLKWCGYAPTCRYFQDQPKQFAI